MSFFFFLLLFCQSQDIPIDPEAVSWFKKGEDLIGSDQEYSNKHAIFYEKALSIEPEFKPALFNLALIYRQQERLSDALALLDTLILIDSNNEQAYLLRVEIRMRSNEISLAKSDINLLKRLAPKTFSTWQSSGRLNYHLERMDLAISDFKKALDLNSKSPDLHLDLALALDEIASVDSATPHFKYFLNHFPKDPKANFLLGRNLMKREKFEDALDYFEKARQLGFPKTSLNEHVAYTLLRLDRFDEARAFYMEAGESAATLFNLGTIAEKNGRMMIAELYFRQAALKDYNNPEIWSSLGHLYSRESRHIEAQEALQRAIELGANDFESLLQLGIAQANTEEFQIALNTLKKALNGRPESGEASFFLGIVHEQLKEEKTALLYYERALANRLNTAQLHFRMGVLYSKCSRADESVEHFSQALTLDRAKYLPILKKELLNVASDLDAIRYKSSFNKLLNENDRSKSP